jgi:predicted esterase
MQRNADLYRSITRIEVTSGLNSGVGSLMIPGLSGGTMHRACITGLLFVCFGLAALGQTQSSRLGPSLKDQALQALNQHDLKAAAVLYEQWLQADPQDHDSWYNLACVRALAGDNRRALDAWDNAVAAGWTDSSTAERDSDLASIRDESRFQDGLKAIAARKAAATPDNSSVHWLTMQIRGTYEVLLPPDYDKSNRQYPICVLLHGNGDNESRFARLADSVGREGVIYIAVRAPYGSNGSADSYTAWPPDHVDDNLMPSIRNDYVNWIFNVVRAVQKEYRVGPRQVFIHGFSQGGQFALLSALLHPDLVKSVFVQSGSAAPASYFTPASLAAVKKAGVTVWISQGEQDTTVLPENSQKLATQLKNAGIPVTMRLLPGVHTITKEMVEFTKEWKKKQIGE